MQDCGATDISGALMLYQKHQISLESRNDPYLSAKFAVDPVCLYMHEGANSGKVISSSGCSGVDRKADRVGNKRLCSWVWLWNERTLEFQAYAMNQNERLTYSLAADV